MRFNISLVKILKFFSLFFPKKGNFLTVLVTAVVKYANKEQSRSVSRFEEIEKKNSKKFKT